MSRLKTYKCRAVNKQFFELQVDAMNGEEALSKALGIDMEDWVNLGQAEFWVEDDELPTEIRPSHWDEDPGWPVCDWQMEVENGDTRQGYAEWVESQQQEATSDGESHDN